MNLVRFQNPHYKVNRSLIDELFNDLLNNDAHENYSKSCVNQPATNVFETENDFRIEMLLPGYSKKDLKMNYHKNLLTVKVEKEEKEEKAELDYKYEHREFGKFDFEKQFRIPKTVNVDAVEAKFENGILNILLPKKEEALEKAPVEIKVS